MGKMAGGALGGAGGAGGMLGGILGGGKSQPSAAAQKQDEALQMVQNMLLAKSGTNPVLTQMQSAVAPVKEAVSKIGPQASTVFANMLQSIFKKKPQTQLALGQEPVYQTEE